MTCLSKLDSSQSDDYPVVDRSMAAMLLPVRSSEGNKGTFGTLTIIGGSENYCGAPQLCGRAAYRSGCGLVRMAVPESVKKLNAGAFPEAVWDSYPTYSSVAAINCLKNLRGLKSKRQALVVGPGMGFSPESSQFLRTFLGEFTHASLDIPLVLDADALNLLAADFTELGSYIPSQAILTPHPGEMSRLCGLSVTEIQHNRQAVAEAFCAKHDVVLVLKGANSLIADQTHGVYMMSCATSALAKAGTGDVLAGMCGSFLAQGMPPYDAARLAVYLHAHAGLIAERTIGNPYAILASDVIGCIGNAITECQAVAG